MGRKVDFGDQRPAIISGDLALTSTRLPVHQLAERLHLGHVYLVGHDIGGVVAYAFVRRYPATSRGVMIIDVPLPGIEPWDVVKAAPIAWHIKFHQTPDLPEQLLAGREAIYFRYSLDRDTFSDADVARFARSYAAPNHLRAMLEIYRAFLANEKFNAAQQSANRGASCAGARRKLAFRETHAEHRRSFAGSWVRKLKVEVVKNSVHYVVDEQPEAVAELNERYAR